MLMKEPYIMLLATERLFIVPLNYEQLVMYLQRDGKLEEMLNVEKAPYVIPQDLLDALNEVILPSVADKACNYLYFTLWTIISKELNQRVGDICFKGEPNNRGEVEIGYGTYERFQGMGYMTEAVKAMTDWVFDQPGVTAVVAETDQSNFASQRILKKNNFKQYKIIDKMKWWRIKRLLLYRLIHDLSIVKYI